MMSTTTSIQTQAEAEGRDAQVGRARALREFLSRQYLSLVLVVVAVVLGFLQPSFWGSSNLTNILFQAAFVGISACGMTLLIVGGILDLSVAGVIAIGGILISFVLPHTIVGNAILLALVVGAGLGLLNGLLVTYLRIAPFIATLGTLYLFQGVAFIMTDGHVSPISSRAYRSLATGSIGPIPHAFIALIVVALITYFLLFRTTFGRTVRATGSNEVAAVLTGLPVRRTKVLTFVFAGICFALAGVFMAGRLSGAEATMSQGIELQVIAAVVVGGTSLRGGRGSVFGTVMGALLLAVLANALNLMRVASYWQYVLTGVVVVVAVAIGARRASAAEVRGAS